MKGIKEIAVGAIVGASIVAILFCALMLGAPEAKSEPNPVDVARNAKVICEELDKQSDFDQLNKIANDMYLQGIPVETEVAALTLATSYGHCPRYRNLVIDWARSVAGPTTKM